MSQFKTNKRQKTTDNQNELFILVDKSDNIISYKTRKECHQNKNLIHRAIHILITNDKSEILMQKRSATKDLQPGYYTLSVGGHVTKGETYESTAERELEEELGISIPFKKVLKYLAEVEDQTEFVTIFKGISNGPFKTDKKEVEYAKFFTKQQLRKIKNKITPISILSLKQLNLL